MAERQIDDDAVRRWIDNYLNAWRTHDRAKIEALFTADASYRPRPDSEPAIGRTAIADAWLEDSAIAGSWKSELAPMMIHGDTAIITGWTDYLDDERYLNLWIVRFGEDGACADFTEWWMERRG